MNPQLSLLPARLALGSTMVFHGAHKLARKGPQVAGPGQLSAHELLERRTQSRVRLFLAPRRRRTLLRAIRLLK